MKNFPFSWLNPCSCLKPTGHIRRQICILGSERCRVKVQRNYTHLHICTSAQLFTVFILIKSYWKWQQTPRKEPHTHLHATVQVFVSEMPPACKSYVPLPRLKRICTDLDAKLQFLSPLVISFILFFLLWLLFAKILKYWRSQTQCPVLSDSYILVVL